MSADVSREDTARRQPGYSLEPPLAERAYLEGELGLQWIHVDPRRLVDVVWVNWRSRRQTTVIASKPGPLLEVMKQLPDRSLKVLLLSDEQYHPSGRMILDQPQTDFLLRNYSTMRLSSWAYTALTCDFAIEATAAPETLMKVPLLIKRGLRNRKRASKWKRKGGLRFEEFPLGYTDAFAAQYRELVPGSARSDSLFSAGLPASAHRDLDFSFRGQRAQAQRRLGLKLAARFPRTQVDVVGDGWMGYAMEPSEDSYVRMLTNTRFALCPPGWSCNESFRVAEALICGALPVGLASCLSQGTASSLLSPLGIFEKSWARALDRACSLDEDVRVAMVEGARAALGRQVHRARELLERASIDQ